MSLAMKYAMKKRMAKGCKGEACPGCEMCKGGMMMAEGGEVMQADDDDIISRIMKARSRDDTPALADHEANDFDVLPAMETDDEANYTGADSGDEIGDEQLDEDEHDIVARVMRSRKKKDRIPRTA